MTCSQETLEGTRERLLSEAGEGGKQAGFLVEMVVLTGILNWNYEVQVPLSGGKA